jgi:hypothetical protein
LRADIPGKVVQSGDIDNRLKTLFDALRMPASDLEMAECASGPANGEEPFFSVSR